MAINENGCLAKVSHVAQISDQLEILKLLKLKLFSANIFEIQFLNSNIVMIFKYNSIIL